jgi:hypothetical protein
MPPRPAGGLRPGDDAGCCPSAQPDPARAGQGSAGPTARTAAADCSIHEPAGSKHAERPSVSRSGRPAGGHRVRLRRRGARESAGWRGTLIPDARRFTARRCWIATRPRRSACSRTASSGPAMTRPGSSSCGTSSAHDDLEHDRATGKLVVRVRHENKSHAPGGGKSAPGSAKARRDGNSTPGRTGNGTNTPAKTGRPRQIKLGS